MAAQVDLREKVAPDRERRLAHDERIVRFSRQGNSYRIVARSPSDIAGWVQRLGAVAGEVRPINVGLEDIFFHLTLQQQTTSF